MKACPTLSIGRCVTFDAPAQPDQGLTEVADRLEREKLFGTELIRPVMEILERNAAQFNPDIWRERKKRLQAIAEHAE